MDDNIHNWIKFNDLSSTVIKKDNISFFNKETFIESPISFNSKKSKKMYKIVLYINNTTDDTLQIHLCYSSPSKRNKDYITLFNTVNNKIKNNKD